MPKSLQWAQVEPVLRAAWDRSEQVGSPGTNSDELAEWMSADPGQVCVALEKLGAAGYLEVTLTFGPTVFLEDFTEKGLQAVGGWPTGPADGMLESLLAAIEHEISEADGDVRTRLERFRDAAAGMGRELAIRVLTEAAAGRVPH